MSSNMSYGAWKMMLKGVIQMAQELNGTSSDAEASSQQSNTEQESPPDSPSFSVEAPSSPSNTEQESPPDSPSFSVEAPSSPSNTEQEDNEVYYKDPYPNSPYTHSLELVKRAFDM
jgi:hypothetical protein